MSSNVKPTRGAPVKSVNLHIGEIEPGVAKVDPIIVADHVTRSFGGLTAVDVAHVEIPRNAWRNDLMRASLQKLPVDKQADLSNQVTPYDVVPFGKDQPGPKAVASQRSAAISESLIAKADAEEERASDRSPWLGFMPRDSRQATIGSSQASVRPTANRCLRTIRISPLPHRAFGIWFTSRRDHASVGGDAAGRSGRCPGSQRAYRVGSDQCRTRRPRPLCRDV